jgi:hypothetical protein
MNAFHSLRTALGSSAQGLWRTLFGQPVSPAPRLQPALVLSGKPWSLCSGAACGGPAAARAPRPVPARPLRVVRVMEAGQPRSDIGRIVISGRMADVCAELDRLAASEAAGR